MPRRKTRVSQWKLIVPITTLGLAILTYGVVAPNAASQVRTGKTQVRTEKPSTSVEAPDVLITRTCVSSYVAQMRICASGNCQHFTSSCFPYLCDAATSTCRDTCVNDHSCVATARCYRSQCVVPSWSCVTEGPGKGDLFDGIDQTVDCRPYRCSRGPACPRLCYSTGDCEHPFRCDAQMRCVHPDQLQ
jgi:hypothetical protein